MSPDVAIAFAIIAPVMAIAGSAYRLGHKLQSVEMSLEKMRKELDQVREENTQLSAQLKALRDLLTVIVTKDR